MKNIELAQKYQDYMVSARRYLHENPELSGREFNTVKFIMGELDKMGIEYIEVENGGVLGFIRGKAEGKTVLLRADCDALPVLEKENLTNSRCVWSKNEGVMHACGHDAHTAALLGAAKVLLDKKEEINGTVILCFERGEEGSGNVKYIFAYLEKNGYHIDSCFGMHTHLPLGTGKVAVNDTNACAGAFGFEITIEGRGGHGSRPDQAENPIDCFVAIYQRLQSLRLTKLGPFQPATYSVGQLSSGLQGNVIPQTLTFSGTMRYYDDSSVETFKEEFRHVVDSVCEAYHCTATYNRFAAPGFATVNDPECASFARQVFARELGEEAVTQVEPLMGSESYSQYLKQWPGCFGFLGVHNPAKGTGAANHNEKFDVDEDALATGAACHATYAIEFLESDFVPTHHEKMTFSQCLKVLGRDEELKELY